MSSDSCISKWILAQRISDAQILSAVDRAYAVRQASQLAELRFLDTFGYESIVPLEDVLNLLPKLDPAAVRIKATVMMMHGKVHGCFCGTLGQCCMIGKEKTPPSRQTKRGSKRKRKKSS